MTDRTYYVTVQDENGEAVGGRLHIAAGVEVSGDALRNEGGFLVWHLLKELWSHG